MRFLSLCSAMLCMIAGSAYSQDTYRVSISRVGQDFYKEENSGTIIQTRYCYEYVSYADAILVIDSPSGYNIGRLIFLDMPAECEVQALH